MHPLFIYPLKIGRVKDPSGYYNSLDCSSQRASARNTYYLE